MSYDEFKIFRELFKNTKDCYVIFINDIQRDLKLLKNKKLDNEIRQQIIDNITAKLDKLKYQLKKMVVVFKLKTI